MAGCDGLRERALQQHLRDCRLGVDPDALADQSETGARERVTLEVATLGQVTMEPNTRLRLINTRAGDHRLALAHGTLHATIWAPPNQFFVETPSSLAIDLGCAYTLTVDDEGVGLVNVLVGWVGFKWRDRESLIPAGSSCQTRPHVVWFGEMPLSIDEIMAALDACGLFISIGTSGAVYPAAGFVQHVRRQRRARTVELNMERSDGYQMFHDGIYGPATEIVPAFVDKLLSGRTSHA